MRVQIAVDKYRTRFGQETVRGDVVELPEHVAEKLIRLRIAVSVPKLQEEATNSETPRVHKPKPRKQEA